MVSETESQKKTWGKQITNTTDYHDFVLLLLPYFPDNKTGRGLY